MSIHFYYEILAMNQNNFTTFILVNHYILQCFQNILVVGWKLDLKICFLSFYKWFITFYVNSVKPTRAYKFLFKNMKFDTINTFWTCKNWVFWIQSLTSSQIVYCQRYLKCIYKIWFKIKYVFSIWNIISCFELN